MNQKEMTLVLKKMKEEINLRKEYSVNEFAFIFDADYESSDLLPAEFNFDLYKISYMENGFIIWEIIDDNEGEKDDENEPVEPAWNLTFYYLEYDLIKGITNVF